MGLNILGLPTLRQGGAGLLSGLEARGFAATPDVDLRVLAEPGVAEELSEIAGVVSRPAAPAAAPAKVAGVARELRNPQAHLRDHAVAGCFDDRDVIHYPLSFMAAPANTARTVVTSVDLQHLHFPQFFSRKDRLLRAFRWHRSIRRADRIAVYSSFVRESLIERLRIDGDRIDVVGACCSERFGDLAAAKAPDASLGRFLLYPASPLPAKNHQRLLAAFAASRARRESARLVLVGPATHDWGPVRGAVSDHGLGDQVTILGHVSLGELAGLYRAAVATVYPSLFEGFGIPVLEAMTAGCPVIAADAASIPEVAGDAANLFDPLDEKAIADSIDRVCSADAAERERMIAAGVRQAQRFGPDLMLKRLLGSFRAAVATMQRS